MCCGNLCLAGDAAHYQHGDSSGLEQYSARALARVWKAQPSLAENYVGLPF